MTLDEKIQHSIDLLKKGEPLALALQPDMGYYVAFSGGKDSQAMLELVKMAGVKYRAFYSVTGNDPPENISFIRKNYPEVNWVHPKEKFFKLVEKKGMPTINMRFCCERIKEGMGAGCVVLTGVRAEESLKRSRYAETEIWSRRKEHQGKPRERDIAQIMENEHQCIKGKDRVMVRPILSWTEEEIWAFIRLRNLPVNPCYTTLGRVGCMFCPFASTKQIEAYENRYPKMLDCLLKHIEVWFLKFPNPTVKSAAMYYAWWKSKAKLNHFLKDTKMADWLTFEVNKAAGRIQNHDSTV